MKTLVFTFSLIISSNLWANPLKDSMLQDLNGTPLSRYSGKVVLMVNIATQCGYTPQLKGLEALYQELKEKGLVIVGIPSNDFGEQTPQDSSGVQKFCAINFGVTFPLTEKLVVKGPQKHPFISQLLLESPSKQEIQWNFEKFVINKEGKVIGRFKSSEKPDSQKMRSLILSSL